VIQPSQRAIITDPSRRSTSRSKAEGAHLLLILLSLVVDDVVEAELVDTLGGGDDAEPVTELLLLEVLLSPVKIRKKVVSGPSPDVSNVGLV
jgi:hypothetical protein